MEQFNYILQKSKYNTLQEDIVRTLFLKKKLEEYIEILNLMASGDIYHKSFDEICELCRKYSRSKAKTGKIVRDGFPQASKSVDINGVTRMEIGNLLEKF